ncbi:hypothetical protein L1887_14922 [Cichorium endivia]|nr:hypothetical protein L1887_14922 [Cichorium endivia]
MYEILFTSASLQLAELAFLIPELAYNLVHCFSRCSDAIVVVDSLSSRRRSVQVANDSAQGKMTQVNVKGALGKKPSASGPEVWNRKKMIAPRLLNIIVQKDQQTKSSNSAHDACASISKLSTKPSSASTPTVPKPLTSTTKTTLNSLVKSTISTSMPKPTTPPTQSPTPTPTTVTVSNPLHTSTNTESMPEATTTQSPRLLLLHPQGLLKIMLKKVMFKQFPQEQMDAYLLLL